MIHYLRKFVKQAFDKHPLIANCITYGTFTTSAEFLQQSLSIHNKSNTECNDDKAVSVSFQSVFVLGVLSISVNFVK